MMTQLIRFSDRGFPTGDPAQGTGLGTDAGQDEDRRRTARRLPATHSRAKRVTHWQRRTLQHAPD